MHRRTLLRSAGVSLALPFLETMRPALGAASRTPSPRRMVAINTNLGLLSQHFYPEQAGRDFELSPYLEQLAPFRDKFTVISGTSHPDVTGGHSAEASFLTAAPHPSAASFRNSVSLDQFAAARIGHHTRVPALPLVVAQNGNQSLSFTQSGVMIPAERSPAAVFRALFVSGDPAQVERQLHDLKLGRSILDVVSDRASSLRRTLGHQDQQQLDQYFEAIREVERRLLAAEEWEQRPKPEVEEPAPVDGEHLLEQLTSMFQLIRLALATDSTRLITLMIRLDGFSSHIPGVNSEAHNLSHHVGRADKLVELKNLELAQFQKLASLFQALDGTPDGDATLLDNTMLLFGSNLGNGNNHDTRNLPILLAGGGFRHGQHLAFDRDKNHPLPDLFVSMLNQLGIDAPRFASGTAPLPGLQPA